MWVGAQISVFQTCGPKSLRSGRCANVSILKVEQGNKSTLEKFLVLSVFKKIGELKHVLCFGFAEERVQPRRPSFMVDADSSGVEFNNFSFLFWPICFRKLLNLLQNCFKCFHCGASKCQVVYVVNMVCCVCTGCDQNIKFRSCFKATPAPGPGFWPCVSTHETATHLPHALSSLAERDLKSKIWLPGNRFSSFPSFQGHS